MDKHYFIGIPMPGHIHPIAQSKQEELQLRNYYKSIPHLQDLHITLLFIGAFPREKVQPLCELLRKVSEDHLPFPLQLNGVSSFGSNRTPRVIYLSVEHSDQLNHLQKDISENAEVFLTKPKNERFTPHVTIAKKWKGENGFEFQKEHFNPIQIDINSFSLFEINPSQNPKYLPVETFKLSK